MRVQIGYKLNFLISFLIFLNGKSFIITMSIVISLWYKLVITSTYSIFKIFSLIICFHLLCFSIGSYIYMIYVCVCDLVKNTVMFVLFHCTLICTNNIVIYFNLHMVLILVWVFLFICLLLLPGYFKSGYNSFPLPLVHESSQSLIVWQIWY